jgi:hypothetical protein
VFEQTIEGFPFRRAIGSHKRQTSGTLTSAHLTHDLDPA